MATQTPATAEMDKWL